MAVKKEAWRERLDRVDATLDKVGERLDSVGEKLDYVGERLKETESIVNGIGKSNGIVAEEYFQESIKESVKKGLYIKGLGAFKKAIDNYTVTHFGHERAEFDLILENDKYIVLIEVKHRLDKRHLGFFTDKKDNGLDKGLSRLAIFKKYEKEWVKYKTVVTMFATLGLTEKTLASYMEKKYHVLRRKGGNILIEYPITGTKKANR